MTRSSLGRGAVSGGLLALLVAGVLALAPATGARAHDSLVDSTPKAGSVQTQPLSTVTLTFSDRILDLKGDGSGSLMQVTGPDARHYETGCATALDRMLSVPVSLGLGGKYLVTFQLVSADGHTVSSSIEFTYRPPSGSVASAGNAVGPPCGQLNTTGSRVPSGTAGGTPGGSAAQSGDLGIVLGIAIGIVVLALAGVLIVVVTARRRPRDEG